MNIRNSIPQATNVDYTFIKKQAFFDQGILIVNIDDPRLGWVEQQMLKTIAEKLYGKKPAGS